MAFRQDYEKLKAECLRTGRLFQDPYFPASGRSLKKSGPYPAYISWRRPQDIVKDPRFIVKGATRFDLDQGALGDCWFIAAAANLAVSNEKLFDRCVPKDQYFTHDYAGIFRFWFWRFGKWTEVVVDDRLPTRYGRLMYANNREEPSEFWAALFEKAYAKLYGCYENIDGGHINDALVDFTGGISEVFHPKRGRPFPSNFFEILRRTLHMNSMMGCSIPASAAEREKALPYGLFAGHAYSINSFKRVNYRGREVELMRLRNPWGRKEWTGPWGDWSSEWKSLSYTEREQLGLEPKDDGEFWLSYEDFVRNFEKITITHLWPDALTAEAAKDMKKRPWDAITHHSSWIRGVSAGGCGNSPYEDLYWTNPQFQVTVTDANDDDKDGRCTLVVSLIQKDENRSADLFISFGIYKLRSGVPKLLNGQNYDKYSVQLYRDRESYVNVREQTRRFIVSPGTYIVIPSTFKPYKESEFILRIYTEKPSKSSGEIIDETDGWREMLGKAFSNIRNILSGVSGRHTSDNVSSVSASETDNVDNNEIYAIFRRFTGGQSTMDAFELKHALNEMMKEDIHVDGFCTESSRSILAMGDRSRNGSLTYSEFARIWSEIDFWRTVFKRFDKDGSGRIDTYELSRIFTEIGFSLSRDVQRSIVMRYGGKARHLSIEDFIVCMSKVLTMYNTWFEHSDSDLDGKREFTLEQFLSTTMYYS